MCCQQARAKQTLKATSPMKHAPGRFSSSARSEAIAVNSALLGTTAGTLTTCAIRCAKEKANKYTQTQSVSVSPSPLTAFFALIPRATKRRRQVSLS